VEIRTIQKMLHDIVFFLFVFCDSRCHGRTSDSC
jgi:hypothetical protein